MACCRRIAPRTSAANCWSSMHGASSTQHSGAPPRRGLCHTADRLGTGLLPATRATTLPPSIGLGTHCKVSDQIVERALPATPDARPRWQVPLMGGDRGGTSTITPPTPPCRRLTPAFLPAARGGGWCEPPPPARQPARAFHARKLILSWAPRILVPGETSYTSKKGGKERLNAF